MDEALEQRLRDAEGRLATIARASEIISSADDAGELLYEISRIVGEHLAARRCLFTEIDLEHDRGIVRSDYCRGVASIAGVYRISDYPASTLREMRAGRTVVNDDAMTDPRTARDYEKTYAPHGERAYVAVPLLREGRWVAELWISDDVPRQWNVQDIALMTSVAERTWTAVEKLRMHAALRESETRVKFVGELAEVGYWDWNIAAESLYWSPVCYRLHGIPEGEGVTHARFLNAIHPEDRARVGEAVRASQEQGSSNEYDVECRVLLPDGTVRWLQEKGSTIVENGAAVRMAGISLDITHRKMLELEREEASVAKDHFLALLSHELRTPMTTILGWASFIRSGMADVATAKRGVDAIEQASRVQARLIDDLLDVSRIVTGKLALDRQLMDATEPVRAAVEVIQPAARAASIDVIADFGHEPAFVLGDTTRLQQVVWNLLSNAVKFTQAGGEVRVSVVELEDAIEIVVRDTGVGIEPEFVPRVFERFLQAEVGPRRRFGGLGLGLSIVRHIVEMHHGTVRAESEGLGRGATFIVHLPRARAAMPATPGRALEEPLRARALSGVSVLLVDDDDSAREVLATMLAGFGAHVTHASSASQAVQFYEQAQPDVLVSDIGMPDEDGYSLRYKLDAIPAVAVTAYADPLDRARALEAGFGEYLAKPVEPQDLVAAVLRVLD
jgi:PAS domain S-box-containing protein